MTSPPSMIPGFYIAGGTLPRNAACYVSRKADEDLLEGLRAGQFCYVLTSRQMGKSCIFSRITIAIAGWIRTHAKVVGNRMAHFWDTRQPSQARPYPISAGPGKGYGG